jgi:hypothetical protein
VWALVADIPRMGQWSPICYRTDWLESTGGPQVGARFVGHNRQSIFRWSRECEITVADPGRELAFRTFVKGRESTRWRYQFTPAAGGTEVVESYQSSYKPPWVRTLERLPGMKAKAKQQAHAGMEQTLQRLKVAAEAPTTVPADPHRSG